MRLILDAEPPHTPSMGPLRLPQSSVSFPVSVPPDEAPPWFCLSTTGTPVALRRYLSTSRRCDVVSKSGRWLLESCLIPRTLQFPEYLHIGWDLAFGDVEPGWCIVYAGARLWFPQLILRVEDESEDWQRVWTLSDAITRHVWPDEFTYAIDNGLAQDWGIDDIPDPMWEPDGPWWPLQREPLSPTVRRFVLDKFKLAVECPSCGGFGRPVSDDDSESPHVVPRLGCPTGFWEADYMCDCGFAWDVGRQGHLSRTTSMPPRYENSAPLDSDELVEGAQGEPPGELYYGDWEDAPFGADAEDYVADAQNSLLPELDDLEEYDYEMIRKIYGAQVANNMLESRAEHEAEMSLIRWD